MGVCIVTDSTACLDKDVLEELKIVRLPLLITHQGSTYIDAEISGEEYEKLLNSEEGLPTTSHPPLLAFYEVFVEAVKNERAVVGIFLSSQLSGTVSTAVLAKKMVLEEYPQARIEIIDSQSAGMGFAVREAAKAALRGESMEKIGEITRETLSNTKFLITIPSLENLKRGGRIGGARALIGSILRIRPVLTLNNGQIGLLEKPRTKEKALGIILDVFSEDIQTNGLKGATVGHVCAEQDAAELAKRLEEIAGQAVNVRQVSCVLAVHLGKGALALSYYLSK